MRPTVAKRFWSKVASLDENGCLLWTAATNEHGYGQFRVGSLHDGSRRLVKAHVYAWNAAGLIVPPGLELDHLCRVRRCVHPGHLETVTHRENTLRGESPSALAARKTHCLNGHPFDPPRPGGGRDCRSCRNARLRTRRRAAAREGAAP